ncbi:VanZ family protein [Romboutsia weinsteinii]|uniref:VanZ family protein n=1 Tax=Romboutsia weinsteinii TaxID=2020949 RepID=A0A371J4L3_9FIRM|nr:VanZ family protein [Romboutsia weinsteinii]RDY27699.1 VanZ family protein [Romboutsia weinsteinii]
MENKVEKKNSKGRYILYIIFITYLVVLFKIVLFKYEPLADIIKGDIGADFRSANLIPFKTILDFFSIGMKDNSLLWAFSNIFGNVCIFMPLGYLLPLFFEKFRSLKNIVIVALAVSMFFELSQYFGYLGSLDIDDLILNTLGGVSGYLVYVGIKKLTSNDKKLNQVTIILSAIACIGAFTIAREQFGSLLGLTNHEVTTIGQENLPQREPDIMGTYLNTKNEKIYMYKGMVAENSSDIDFSEKLNVEINDKTKFYCTEIDELKNESIITYKELSKEEFLKYESYSILKVWYDESDNGIVDTIEVSKKIPTSGSAVTIESNEKKEIHGDVEEVNNRGVVINLITVQESENGSSISVVGKDEHANLIKVEFSSDAKFTLNIGKANGDIIERKDCKKEDIQTKDTVALKGTKNGEVFIADDIEITRVVE